MKREELKAMGLTDEQIESIMADVGKSIQKATSLAEKYKEDAERAEALQRQIDEINNANLSKIEKANKLVEESTKKVAELATKNNPPPDILRRGISLAKFLALGLGWF